MTSGRCNETDGSLNIALDNSTVPELNFLVVGLQCVHKVYIHPLLQAVVTAKLPYAACWPYRLPDTLTPQGLVSCRSNEEDTKDCLILIAAPSLKDSPPCSLAQGERYQFYLQKQTNGSVVQNC